MKTSFIVLYSLLAAGTAAADGIRTTETPVKVDSIEITAGGAYHQNVGDMEGPGGGGDVSIGVRLSPNLLVGAYGTISGYSNGGASDSSGTASAGLKADWHFRPTTSTDPWLSLGAGIKTMWNGGPDLLDRTLLGVELVNAKVGVDYRLTPAISLGPVIGGTATLYTHEKSTMTSGYESLGDKDVDITLSAGIQGRFNL